MHGACAMDANNTSKYAITALYKKYKSKRGHMDHIRNVF